jgi:glycosyltransferase involved in cell wall biosynthesis
MKINLIPVYLFAIRYPITRKMLIRISPRVKSYLRRKILLANQQHTQTASKEFHIEDWIREHFQEVGKSSELFSKTTSFSIILPVYKIEKRYLEKLFLSLSIQSFKDFEICIAAHGTSIENQELIEKWANNSLLKIKVNFQDKNEGISVTSNAALALASNEFCILLDHDDEIPSHGLKTIAISIDQNPQASLFYTDKRTIASEGQTLNVLLKPSWSPEMMLSANYLTHLNAIRTSSLKEINGWDPATDGAQDWDIFLRLFLNGAEVVHVPGVCYSWRQVPTSVSSGGFASKPYARNGQLVTIQRYLDAQFPGSKVSIDEHGTTTIEWQRNDFVIHCFSDEFDVLTGEVINKLQKLQGVEYVILASENIAIENLGNLGELTGPLSNKNVAAVGPTFVNTEGNTVDGARVRMLSGEYRPLFYDVPNTHWSILGSASWIRNSSQIAPSLFCIRVADLLRIQKVEPRLTPAILIEKLANDGRLVTLPNTRFKSNKSNLPPVIGAADDPYIGSLIQFGIHGPELRSPGQPKEMNLDTFSLQASYFVENIPYSKKTFTQSKSTKPKRIAWILPGFVSSSYGGIRTILRFADHLQEDHKIESHFFVGGSFEKKMLRKDLEMNFPSLVNCQFSHYSSQKPLALESFDIAVATLWTTAFDLATAEGDLLRVYLVQDYEPDFYPAGTLKILAHHSYQLGLKMICNTEGLSQTLALKHITSEYFNPGIEREIFHAKGRSYATTGPVRIFFYMRPGHHRNCFEINLYLIKNLKNKYGSKVEIVIAGAEFNFVDYGIDNLVKYVGMVPYRDNGEMYRTIDIGVSLMSSSHPSYPPLEMMASGVAVVTNFNPETKWIFEKLPCEFAFGSPQNLLTVISKLIENPSLRIDMGKGAAEKVVEILPDWKTVSQNFTRLILE